jgi:hypothetical protein
VSLGSIIKAPYSSVLISFKGIAPLPERFISKKARSPKISFRNFQ